MDQLVINDLIYGQQVITEPVVLELIQSKTFQRLQDIDQGGYAPICYNPHNISPAELKKNNRFEHSVGVYLLLNKYNDSLESQVSGLLHDVSHPPFSHCVDYVFEEEGSQTDHSFQDNRHADFIKNSEISDILKKYKFDPDQIIHEANFLLLENKIPDICADRIDYSLRTALLFKEYSNEQTDKMLDDLKAEAGVWYFAQTQSARDFAGLFKKMNDYHYSGLPTAVAFTVVSKVLKYCLRTGYLEKADFDRTDSFVLNKIKANLKKDEILAGLYRDLNNRYSYQQVEKGEYSIFCKSRVIDPYVKQGGKLARLSGIYKDWSQVVTQDLKPKKYYLEKT
ncbi:MAG TPA: HD domain-containing protein [Patescibacteria group bacterium]